MQQQSTVPIEMPTMPGVRVSPYAGLAKILQGYIAGKELSSADETQKAYETSSQEDIARLLRNIGQYETVPGQVIKPAVTGEYPEKQNTLPTGEAYPAVDISAGAMPITPSSAEVRAPDRQVPYLSADLLDPNNPNAMKTGTGRMMLAQVLMQQQAQQQAAAQAELAASRLIHTVKPGETAYRIGANGVPVPFLNTPAQPKWEHTSKFENGQEVTGWVNTNAADIPGSFVKGAVKPEMTESQRLDAQLKQYTADVEAAKSQDVGRKSIQFQPLPKGVPVGAKRTGGKTPDGKDVYELNGKKYVGD
jgi:LysM repeat protein